MSHYRKAFFTGLLCGKPLVIGEFPAHKEAQLSKLKCARFDTSRRYFRKVRKIPNGKINALQWRHDEHSDVVWNHRRLHGLLNRFVQTQKISKLRVTAIGIMWYVFIKSYDTNDRHTCLCLNSDSISPNVSTKTIISRTLCMEYICNKGTYRSAQHVLPDSYCVP